MKVKVTGVWRSVNYKAEGVGLVMHLSSAPSPHSAVVEKVTVVCVGPQSSLRPSD